MLRMIIKPESDSYHIKIPKEYINTEIEILVLPFTHNKSITVKQNNRNIFQKTSGILKNKKIDPVEWQKNIRNEYER